MQQPNGSYVTQREYAQAHNDLQRQIDQLSDAMSQRIKMADVAIGKVERLSWQVDMLAQSNKNNPLELLNYQLQQLQNQPTKQREARQFKMNEQASAINWLLALVAIVSVAINIANYLPHH